ncbi:MAG: ATP-binding protein [Caldilineaceae bacterium]
MVELSVNREQLGAYALPRLVGRDSIITQIEDAAISADHTPQVIVLIGKGGHGKTRLVSTLLNLLPRNKNLLVADALIDLYHLENHTVHGVATSLANVLPAKAEFTDFHQIEEELKSKIATGRGVGNDLTGCSMPFIAV